MGWPAARAAIAVLVASAVVPAAASAQRFETLRIPFPQEDGSLTPYTFTRAYAYMTLVYDTLTWRDARGVPRPWLARSIERSDDGLAVTIRIRRGVRWHDGRPLTASDVAFTFDYVVARPHPRFTPQVRDIASATATRADTVVLRLRRPSLGLLDQPLADVPILPRHLWAGVPRDRLAPPGLPVGSGPYRLAGHDPGRLYRFSANASYFRGRPLVERIDVPIVRRPDRALDDLRNRRADVVPLAAGSEDPRVPGVSVAHGRSYVGTVLMFNLAGAPFDRPEVRRAVAQALDLGRIAGTVGRTLAGRRVRVADRGYVHPDSPWAAPERLAATDLQRARVALAEQGVGRVDVLANEGDPTRLEAARQVVLALQRAGGRARLVERSAGAFNRATGLDDADPDFQVAVTSAPALASYDPAYLDPLFGSGGALNQTGYSSAAFDRLARRVDAARTEARRRAAVTAELRRLARDLPVVPLFYEVARYGFRPTAFDRWEFVTGTGILDKRSFLPRPGAQATAPAMAVRDPLDRSAAPDDSLLAYLLGAAGLLALSSAAVLVRRRLSR